MPKGSLDCLEFRTKKGTMMRRCVQAATCVLAAFSFTTFATAAPPSDAKLRAYGKRLSSECTTCHRIDGADNGFPSIVGWPVEDFIWVLKTYRDGGRTEPEMTSGVHQRLNEKQIQALARFFGSQKSAFRVR